MAKLKLEGLTIEGTAHELVQIVTGIEKAQKLAKNEPVKNEIVGRLAVITYVSNCLCGFKKGDVVRVIEYEMGTSIPFKVRRLNDGGTGWARREDVNFVTEGI